MNVIGRRLTMCRLAALNRGGRTAWERAGAWEFWTRWKTIRRFAARSASSAPRSCRRLNEVLGSNNQGGLSAIVAKLQQSGFGDQVKSWLGNGQNLPISADQLRAVLGSDTVRQLAARYNIPVDQIGQILAQELPKAVDQASPEGHLPHTA
ncbi:uncharacterized protein YidB (DUF937 family) [Bradyrhizobium elkanii]|nr:uncharacterized protein YidB (DUF937 family) [Bradyrhizobium elkanii]MCS3969938.1 uncharacterized protein YidB (DUF937 family) [Bradyrhizobium japonicum]